MPTARTLARSRTVATEASGLMLTPDGKKLVFLSSVYPECGADDACNKQNLDEEAQSKVKARIYTSLLYRHWNEWQSKRRQHLLVDQRRRHRSEGSDAGLRDVPPFSLGGPDDYAISPDSIELAFTMNADPEPGAEHQLRYLHGSARRRRRHGRSPPGLGADDSPQYSPDGKYLAFRSQARAGYESDRWRLMVLDRATGRTTNLTEGLDRWVGSFTWSPDSTRMFFTVEDRGRTGLQMVPATGGGSRNIISRALPAWTMCSSPPTAAP